MIIPAEVTFRGLGRSEAIEALVREHVAKLDTFHLDIVSCRVVVEASHHRHAKGTVYHVRIDVRVPGAELVAGAEPAPGHFHEDVHLAVREAFDQVRRQLEDHARRQRGDVKTHAARPRG